MERVFVKGQKEKLYDSVNSLIDLNPYVGFEAAGNYKKGKYFMCRNGDFRGIACRPEGIWSSPDHTNYLNGDFYVFDSKKELLEWMMHDSF